MEQLGVLEKKLLMLIESKKKDTARINDLVSELQLIKEENLSLNEIVECAKGSSENELEKLLEENKQLLEQVTRLEETLLARHQSIEGLNQERELAKMAVDDLIKSIDILVEQESQQ